MKLTVKGVPTMPKLGARPIERRRSTFVFLAGQQQMQRGFQVEGFEAFRGIVDLAVAQQDHGGDPVPGQGRARLRSMSAKRRVPLAA